MRAARRFALELNDLKLLSETGRIKTELYGSLALTGKGHNTDIAILLGLSGYTPEGVNPDAVPEITSSIRNNRKLSILLKHEMTFNEADDLLFHGDKLLPYHPNGMRFSAFDINGKLLLEKVFYSVGGGFIVDHSEAARDDTLGDHHHPLPHPFATAEAMLDHCRTHNFSIKELMLRNELTWRTQEEIHAGILRIWEVMCFCTERGCHQEGILPGGLNVRRRAAKLWQSLEQRKKEGKESPAEVMEWVSLWALAVNEENAASGRVVTAPTNGSAGVIPAVLHYLVKYYPEIDEEGIITFFLVSGAIGILYKEGASISAAEMGCMGEVGVACSMAAAGLTAALGGTNEQIENAAEIGMEHNLGLTCDPILGLVQIPCIERNTMGAVKAINAALLALAGDGLHRVSLDQVIATMRQTGKDMKSIYKETSQGGLAVNVPEC
jgi:L-serine dehydratase